MKNIFTKIYNDNYWCSLESRSGKGSEISYTENIRKEIPNLIKQFNIKSMLDAPCGDFNWMKELLKEINVSYVGADIVDNLIEDNKQKYPSFNFFCLDITKDKMPKVDLFLNRDCLIHLCYNDILNVFNNFINSKINYILTTTHIPTNRLNFTNTDIKNGEFRYLNLFSFPFFLPEPLYRIEDWKPLHNDYAKAELVLFDKNQIQQQITNITNNIKNK